MSGYEIRHVKEVSDHHISENSSKFAELQQYMSTGFSCWKSVRKTGLSECPHAENSADFSAVRTGEVRLHLALVGWGCRTQQVSAIRFGPRERELRRTASFDSSHSSKTMNTHIVAFHRRSLVSSTFRETKILLKGRLICQIKFPSHLTALETLSAFR